MYFKVTLLCSLQSSVIIYLLLLRLNSYNEAGPFRLNVDACANIKKQMCL